MPSSRNFVSSAKTARVTIGVPRSSGSVPFLNFEHGLSGGEHREGEGAAGRSKNQEQLRTGDTAMAIYSARGQLFPREMSAIPRTSRRISLSNVSFESIEEGTYGPKRA